MYTNTNLYVFMFTDCVEDDCVSQAFSLGELMCMYSVCVGACAIVHACIQLFLWFPVVVSHSVLFQ